LAKGSTFTREARGKGVHMGLRGICSHVRNEGGGDL